MRYPEKYFSVFNAYGFSNFEEGATALEGLKTHCLFNKATYEYNVLIGYEYSKENRDFSIVYYMPRKERLVKINIKIENRSELYEIYELIRKYYSFIQDKEIKELDEYLKYHHALS